ncbi:MAG: DUF2975 domain-containing protein, partial [Bacteroidia bacterium]
MEASKSLTIALLTVKVIRILIIILTAMISIMVIIHLFNPLSFTLSFPLSFEVYENDSTRLDQASSYSKIDVGPFKLITGDYPQSRSIIEDATGQIKLNNVDVPFLLIFYFILILFVSPVYYFLLQLKFFLITVREGNPFIFKNVKRFRRFGVIAISLAILVGIAKFTGGFYVSSNIVLPSNLSIVH